jgi:inhibitor of cysteine peptidase
VKAGEDFFIALPSNPSTGYGWQQTTTDEKIIAYEGNVRQPASQGQPGAPAAAAAPGTPSAPAAQGAVGVPGAPGQQIFIFHANRTGATTIVLTYTRAFEPDAPPARTLTYNVTVE